MPQQLFATLERCDTLILHVMHADHADPLLASLHHSFPDTSLVGMELQRVGIQTFDLHNTPHGFDEYRSLNAANNHTLGQWAIDEVNRFEVKLVHGLSFERCARPGGKLEESGQTGDGAAGDHERARDEDRVQKLESDLAVGGVPLDFGEGKLVVRGQGGGEKVDGGEHVVLLLSQSLLSGELGSIVHE